MSSNYNTRPRPAEVLIQDTRAMLIRNRETLSTLWKDEIIPALSESI
jgi:diaminopimelate decarboxylase